MEPFDLAPMKPDWLTRIWHAYSNLCVIAGIVVAVAVVVTLLLALFGRS